MATLVSPGVSISVVDQSINVGAGPGTVPLIFIVTQQNKSDPTGTYTVAPGTTQASAGVVWSITSQMELVQTFGDPVFYSVSGTSINGYPLNEYGLLAAYSYLGISNLINIVRADIDTAALEPTPITPSSPAAIGTYWFNESALPNGSSYGLFVQSGTFPNAIWTSVTPKFVYNFSTGTTNTPTPSDGVVGNYAVVFQTASGNLSYWVKGIPSNTFGPVTGNGSTTTITASSTTGLQVGMTPNVVAGTGAFATGTYVTAINPGISFTVNIAPSTPLVSASVVAGFAWNQIGTTAYTSGALTGSSTPIYTSSAGATSTGTLVTVTSTTGLLPGMIPLVTAGAGAFAPNTVVTSVISATTFMVNVAPTVPLSGGSTIINAGATISVSSTTGLAVGMIPTVTAGTGVFAPNTVITSVGSSSFTVNASPTTPLSAATVSAEYQVIIQSVWPDLTSPATSQEYWIKTSSAAQGANLVLDIMNATTNTFTQVEAPILANDTTADIYYSTETSGSTGQVYIEPVQTGLGVVSVNSFEFRYSTGATNSWVPLEVINGSTTTPTSGPVNGQYWFNALLGLNSEGQSTVDILVANNEGAWQNVNLPGFGSVPVLPGAPTLYPQSGDPRANIPAPTVNNGDIWVQTDVTPYPTIYRYSTATSSWVLVNNSDQTTPNGIIFRDARPNPNYAPNGYPYTGQNNEGPTNPDLDPDAPQAALYPPGFLLWNTRYSTNNVKTWQSPFVFDGVTASPDNTNNGSTGRWVNASGNNAEGVPYMGADAQQIILVNAINAQVTTNQPVLSDTLFFNLIAAPGFLEVTPGLLILNDNRADTAFVLADTPFDLAATGTALQDWATNTANSLGDGNAGLVSASKYLGLWYPSGLTTNTDGTTVVVPPTHMAMSTIAYNDQVAYPWFAPAGLQRGVVNNAEDIGYVNSAGQFVPTRLNTGQSNVLYTNGINPIKVQPTGGIVIMGQIDRQNYSSATNRINVVRLENYLRYQLNLLAQPFLFEPNDKTTQNAVLAAFNAFFSELITLRAIYDYLVVCDSSNNTPARVAANQLWIDVAIQPEIAIEFIYIPIRIVNTGASLTASVPSA